MDNSTPAKDGTRPGASAIHAWGVMLVEGKLVTSSMQRASHSTTLAASLQGQLPETGSDIAVERAAGSEVEEKCFETDPTDKRVHHECVSFLFF